MLILFSSESLIPNEIGILHQLFDAGLSCFHLRKPHFSDVDCVNYLKQIQPQFYNRIVVHQQHHLAADFSLKGIHLKEYFRVSLKEKLFDYVSNYQQKGFSVSTGFHGLEDLEKAKENYDYQFLSPVFNSISKQGYQGKDFEVKPTTKTIIGLGGVTADKLSLLKAKGFQGAAVLGAVWKATQPVQAFLTLKQAYNS